MVIFSILIKALFIIKELKYKYKSIRILHQYLILISNNSAKMSYWDKLKNAANNVTMGISTSLYRPPETDQF